MGPYDNIELVQLCFRLWLVAWHQAITWTTIELSPKVFCGTHLRTTSQEPQMSFIRNMFSNITRLKSIPKIPVSNELKSVSQLARAVILMAEWLIWRIVYLALLILPNVLDYCYLSMKSRIQFTKTYRRVDGTPWLPVDHSICKFLIWSWKFKTKSLGQGQSHWSLLRHRVQLIYSPFGSWQADLMDLPK